MGRKLPKSREAVARSAGSIAAAVGQAGQREVGRAAWASCRGPPASDVTGSALPTSSIPCRACRPRCSLASPDDLPPVFAIISPRRFSRLPGVTAGARTQVVTYTKALLLRSQRRGPITMVTLQPTETFQLGRGLKSQDTRDKQIPNRKSQSLENHAAPSGVPDWSLLIEICLYLVSCVLLLACSSFR